LAEEASRKEEYLKSKARDSEQFNKEEQQRRAEFETKEEQRLAEFKEDQRIKWEAHYSPQNILRQALQEGVSRGLETGYGTLISSLLTNSLEVYNGNKSFAMAVKDTAKSTGLGTLKGFTITGCSVVAQQLAERSGNILAQQIVNFGTRNFGVILAVSSLAIEACKDIRLWWKGEISGRSCAGRIVKRSLCVGTSLAASVPISMAVAAFLPGAGIFISIPILVIAGVAVSLVTSKLVDWLGSKIFSSEKNIALANAYKYFDVPSTAPDELINHIYRKKCLLYHPDKHLSTNTMNEWHELQISLEIIRHARKQE